MKIIEPQRMDKKASIDDQKVKLDYNFRVLHESMKDLQDRIKMSSSDVPSPEGAIGGVIMSTACWLINPVLGVGMILMTYDGILNSIKDHDASFGKSRIRSLLRAFMHPQGNRKDAKAEELGREIGDQFASQPSR